MHICQAETTRTLETKSNIYSSKLRTAVREKHKTEQSETEGSRDKPHDVFAKRVMAPACEMYT